MGSRLLSLCLVFYTKQSTEGKDTVGVMQKIWCTLCQNIFILNFLSAEMFSSRNIPLLDDKKYFTENRK